MVEIEEIKDNFAKLAAIDSPSLKERSMADYIIPLFREIGVELTEDDSAATTGSTAGNLHGYVKGNGMKPILLVAHMDTVMPAYGKKAVFHENGDVTSDGTTVLGADDLSGVVEIYQLIKYLKQNAVEHRDIELLFTTGEELYCVGAKAYQYDAIVSKEALVLDLSGEIGTAAYAAPTILSFQVNVQGKASHAGFNPEAGIHSIKAACEAIATLPQGHIDKETTANIGLINGGEGSNIVPSSCTIRGEIRSLSHEKALATAQQYRDTFQNSAEKYDATLDWTQQIDIQAYETSTSESIISRYVAACGLCGVEPKLIKTFGGSDNNVFSQHGIKGLVIANSMNNVHSCKEYANVYEMQKVIEMLRVLVTEIE